MPGKRKRALKSPIRITLPVSVACDLERLQPALSDVVHIGGPSSVSVALHCTREVIVDPATLQARSAGEG